MLHTGECLMSVKEVKFLTDDLEDRNNKKKNT